MASSGYALMALGAPAMFLAQFHCELMMHSCRVRAQSKVSNAFPKRSGMILGGITGAFDASSLPLVFYKVVYFANGSQPSLSVQRRRKPRSLLMSRKTFFLSYLALPIL
jgi:hypothetical protein